MPAGTHTLTIPGPVLQRGFWLYVWWVDTPKGEKLYVGRTGDNSSPKAAPPYARMGQHLGHVTASNALRTHLQKRDITPEACREFRLIAHGPLFPEQKNFEEHRKPRDVVAALERKLAEALTAGGYNVLNEVKCKKPLDQQAWTGVRKAFEKHFPEIGA